MNIDANFLPPELALIFVAVMWLITIVIHIAFAVAVFSDAMIGSKCRPVLVTAGIWSLATLFGGVFVAATYWVLHRSTLNPHVASSHGE